jgi:tRNA-specific 2-thiouridylase
MSKIKTVAVAMSGGLDSSISAKMFIDQGYKVFGLFMNFGLDNLDAQTAAHDACQKLGIEFYALDLKADFEKNIIAYFVDTYAAGLTPNPCVLCNQMMKFGRLLEEAKKLGADYLATGHYIRLQKKWGRYRVYRASDSTKDQSYFLYNLKQEQLKQLIFPLAKEKKVDLRKEALAFGLPFLKKESQDICFLKGDHNDFLREKLALKPGDIMTLDGRIVGQHEGLPLYTIGQRRGIEIGGSGPYYVVKLDYTKNILYVASDWKNPILYDQALIANKVNWIAGKDIKRLSCSAVIRYGHKAVPVKIKRQGREYLVQFKRPERAITPGQSVVFYKRNRLLGGGIIVKTL